MAGEDARVTMEVHGEHGLFLLQPVINGVRIKCCIPVESISAAESLEANLQQIVAEVYRRGYRSGFSSCQQVIKDALGIGSRQ